MNCNTKRIVRIAVIALSASLLIGCTRSQHQTPEPITTTPSPHLYLSEEEATNRAVEVASTDEFHFTGTIVEPTNVQAELMTFEDAVSYLQAQGFQRPNAPEASPETMVWVVTMEGQWPVNFPPLREGEPMREPYRHLAVTLEAETGDPLDLSVLSQ